MSEFRIEKLRRAVDITLANGRVIAATVFLEPLARHHDGPQDPRELLNDDEPFFPVETDGRLMLVAKDQVRLATYPVDQAAGIAMGTVDVAVSMVDEAVIRGGVLLEARSGAHRLLDHLNHFEHRFLSLLTDNRTMHCLVNRRMIVAVEPV